MIELTAGAQTRLNDYLAELRRVLQECPSVDPVDVERDVQDHIQAALAGSASPIDETHLDRVLRSLGVPRDWVQDIGQPWYRYPQRMGRELRDLAFECVQRFSAGPESFRLPYLSLAVLAVGCFVAMLTADGDEAAVVVVIAALAAFVLARAAVALHEARPTTAQMWLLAPALLAVYVPLAGALLGWPIVAGGIATISLGDEVRRAPAYYLQYEEADRFLRAREVELASTYNGDALTVAIEMDPVLAKAEQDVELARTRVAAMEHITHPPSWLRQINPVWLAVYATVAMTGLWWLILGLAVWRRPRMRSVLFRPFANNIRGRSGLFLSLVGLVLLVTGLTLGLG